MTNDVIPREILLHGAYLCVRAADRAVLAPLPLDALAQRIGLANEFSAPTPAGRGTVAFVKKQSVTAGAIADDGVQDADVLVHVAAQSEDVVAEFSGEATKLLSGAGARVRTIGGVVRPKAYTGAAMNNFAYVHAIPQTAGMSAPNAFLIPMTKTAEWWAKDWMERHTYFLPRYDDRGRMVAEGHALASADGISCLMRRTYKALTEPAPAGEYDFITYFECADADVARFHAVCAALRDVTKNPEWAFVREGPTWHGRRVPTWTAALA